MSGVISGVVSNGVIVPSMPLPEGTYVEIHMRNEVAAVKTHRTASELRKLPRERRQAALAAAAELAEQDYRDDSP
jgi:hypothetical protein